MNVRCILCDTRFVPDPITRKKILKHPHKIQICPKCKARITTQVTARRSDSIT
ncbi:DUF2197 domain-containing protein [Hazenella sp. IB182357]|uniref:DUF2197 domain-containing protein n=1 Tax=Polycladospora coralii TaxID=2771432 RepID=A0A926NCX5_9BACL|nr:DUF2197 domain-containing protein [Polycladospora coralii]MBS7530250.1 DUF2197 domain-containing protein [Polycladospora coralii]